MPTSGLDSATLPAPMKISAKVPMSSATSEVESLLYIGNLLSIEDRPRDRHPAAPGTMDLRASEGSLHNLLPDLGYRRPRGTIRRHGMAAAEVPPDCLRHVGRLSRQDRSGGPGAAH